MDGALHKVAKKKKEISERLGYTHGVDGMDLDHEITLKVHLLKLGL